MIQTLPPTRYPQLQARQVEVRSAHLEEQVLAPAQRLMDEVEGLAARARAEDNGPRDDDSRVWRVDTPTLRAVIRCQGENPLEGVMELLCVEDGKTWSYHRQGYAEHFTGKGPEGPWPTVIRNQSTGVLTILEP